jgi:hypothetical protein
VKHRTSPRLNSVGLRRALRFGTPLVLCTWLFELELFLIITYVARPVLIESTLKLGDLESYPLAKYPEFTTFKPAI